MMLSSPVRSRRHCGNAALIVGCVTTLVVAGCAGGGGDGGGGQSVPAGASKREYVAALSEMDPVELTVQTISPRGEYHSAGPEAYAKAVEEWSGGAITMEIQYGSSVAGPGEADDALQDGRLDMAMFFPAYDPARYPAFDAWSTADTGGVSDPVAGLMQWNLRAIDSGFGTPELAGDAREQGLRLMLPFPVADPLGLGCTDDRSTLAKSKGARVRVSGQAQTPQIEALGMTSVSLDFTEVYEALQRGTIDCTLTVLGQADQSGYLDVASDWTMGTQVGWANAYTPIAFGRQRWESLPLAARQLLHDRLDVYLKAQFRSTFTAIDSALTRIDEAGGTTRQLGPKATEAVREANKALRDTARGGEGVSDGSALVGRIETASEKWSRIVREAGYESVPYGEFTDWYEKNEGLDLEPLMEKVRGEILDPHRPTR